jgi:diacylglycerol kinase (ATP)
MEGPATRAFFVVNPAAGNGRTGRIWARLRDTAARRAPGCAVAETRAPGEATALARKAAAEGWPLVVAVGGDGTINEVVNGLARGDGGDGPALGLVVTGRGNDACRNLGLAAEPRAALERALAGAARRVDLGVARWADGRTRYFLNAAGVGFDAVVAQRAAAWRWQGTLPYLAAVLETLGTYRPVPAVIEAGGRAVWSGRLTLAVLANGASYGGGMRIAPDADPADGLLDLVVVGDIGPFELLRWLPEVYRGAHVRNPKVTVRRERAVTVRAELPVHTDGEAAGRAPVTVSVQPGALRLRC